MNPRLLALALAIACAAPALAQELRAIAGVHEVQIVAPGPDPSLELL